MDLPPRAKKLLTAAWYGSIAFFILVELAFMYARMLGVFPDRILGTGLPTKYPVGCAVLVSIVTALFLPAVLRPERIAPGVMQDLAYLVRAWVCRLYEEREQRGFPVIVPGDDTRRHS